MGRRLLRWTVWGCAPALLAGCVTVNICLPEETAARAVDRKSRPAVEVHGFPHERPGAGGVSARRGAWFDDFESYAAGPGTWPESWIADANAQDHRFSYVDGGTFETEHGKTLRLHADHESWSAIAYAPVSLGSSFKVSFDAYSTQGCMGVDLRVRPTWTAPGLGLFGQWPSGVVAMFDRIDEGGRVIAGARGSTEEFKISPDKWHHVDLEVRHEGATQTITVTVSDGESRRGPSTFENPAPSGRTFTFLAVSAGVGTVWYDNVRVEQL